MAVRWHNYPDDHLLTQEVVAEAMGVAVSTIARHRMAGLLAYKPTRPITIPVWALRRYQHMMTNGTRDRLHRSLHIEAADAAVYSRLDGVLDKPEDVSLAVVVRETEMLWKKYKAQAKAKAKREARKAA